MLREATNASWVPVRRLPFRRFRLHAAGLAEEWLIGRRELVQLEALQATAAVLVAEEGRRRLWWFSERFWWEEEGLAAEDVVALVYERARRALRRLERARALLAAERAPPTGERAGITLEVKRAVWQRCSGRCVECGSNALLEFDHVIPLAMGGSSTAQNLQLLCAECNRIKGPAL